MARVFRQIANDRLQIREGGGGVALFGLPFLAAGIFVCLAALGLLPTSNATELHGFATPLMLLFGLAFAAVGGALVFGRGWVTIDGSRRLMTKEWGLLRPFWTQPHALDGYTSVMIGFERGDSDSADQFPIELKAPGGPGLRVCRFTEYGTSRACAMAIAAQLRIDLDDTSSDHIQHVPAGQVGLSLRERARLEPRRAESVDTPASLRSTVSYDADGTRIVMPMPRMLPLVIALRLLVLAVPLVIAVPLVRAIQTPTPHPLEWLFLGLLILGFFALPAISALHAWLRSRYGRTIVAVSTEGLLIQVIGIWRITSQTRIAASDVVDVDYGTRESAMASARRSTEQRIQAAGRKGSAPQPMGPGTEWLIAFVSRLTSSSGVTVKTRQGMARFGQGLDDAEIQYLHAVVRRALVR